jgi:hypothetical protein
MHRLVLVAAALSLPPSTAAGDCMPVQLTTQVITLADTAIPSDGGIVVATTVSGKYDPANRGKSAEAVRPTWRMRVNTTTSAPKIDELAPGLAVYRLPAKVSSPITLEDDEQKTVAKVTRSTAKLAAYPAPKVKKLEYHATMSRRSMQRIEATLEVAPAKLTYALVIADTKGKALSWGMVGAGLTQFPYLHSDCGALPNGTSVPKPGDMVTLFFVDSQGRRSPASKPIKLGGKP